MSSFRPKSSKKKFNLEKGMIDYYNRVSETLNNGFSVEDERDIFLSNVFDQLEDDVSSVCRCPKTSSCVEDLIEAASLSQILKILKTLYTEWQLLSEDQSACHVLERLVSILPKYIERSISNPVIMTSVKSSDIKDNEISEDVSVVKLLLAVVDLTVENLETILTHVYASHVLRMLLQVIGGSCVGESLLKSRMSRRRDKEVSVEKKKQENHSRFTDYPIPPLFLKKLKSLSKKIFKQENFGVLLTDPNASPVIQTLLLVLHKNDPDLCQKYIHKVIKASRIKDVEKNDDPELIKLPPVALDNVGSFLVELVLTLASPETYRELYEELFKGRLLQFAAHPKANFVLQRLVSSCKHKEMFEEIFDEVSQHLEDILASSHYGVAVALSERCHKLGTRQEKYTELLMGSFHCLEPIERQIKFAPILASLSTYEVFYQLSDDVQDKTEEKPTAAIPILSNINYHGTLLLQNLLQFTSPKSIVKSLLDLKPVELRNMSCDPCGSHVIDTFFMTENVGEKNRDALLKKFQGLYVELACHRNGSRTLESIWRHLNTKQKTLVATELCEMEAKVGGDRFGWHIHRNFALGHFVKRKNDWIGIQGAKNKKRELFKDFLGNSEASPTKRCKQELERKESLGNTLPGKSPKYGPKSRREQRDSLGKVKSKEDGKESRPFQGKQGADGHRSQKHKKDMSVKRKGNKKPFWRQKDQT